MKIELTSKDEREPILSKIGRVKTTPVRVEPDIKLRKPGIVNSKTIRGMFNEIIELVKAYAPPERTKAF